jgi:hypothetical protein
VDLRVVHLSGIWPQVYQAYFYCNRFFVTPRSGPYILSGVEDTHTTGS